MSKYDLKQEVTDKYSLRGRVFHKLREDILNRRSQQSGCIIISHFMSSVLMKSLMEQEDYSI